MKETMLRETYSVNKALHNSSNLVNAYKALHVPPRRSRAGASKHSRNCAKSSSGRMEKYPALAFRLAFAVRALPAGLMPSGCGGMTAGSSSLLGSSASRRSLFAGLANSVAAAA